MVKKIDRKVELFEEAVREHAFIGTKSEYPDECEEIERNYQLRKKQLLNAIYAIIRGEE